VVPSALDLQINFLDQERHKCFPATAGNLNLSEPWADWLHPDVKG
jgi:hypothetical protein